MTKTIWCAAMLTLTCAEWGMVSLPAAAEDARSGIAFRASATAVNEDPARTIAVDKPARTVANDVMVATVLVRGGTGGVRKTATVTAPSGWKLIRRDDYSKEGVLGGVSSILSYYRVAAASEPASHTWTFDADRSAMASIVSYSGVSTSSPIDAHAGQPTAPDVHSETITAPSVTTTVPNTVAVGFFALHEGAQAITPPAGMTKRFEKTSPEPVAGPRPYAAALTLEMADEVRATPGPTGERKATATTSDSWVAQLIALRPAGSGSKKQP